MSQKHQKLKGLLKELFQIDQDLLPQVAWVQHITHHSGGSGACDKRVACGRGVA